ncbi:MULTISPECIES: hypothetical protein [Actinomycetes]|uniref:Uncharacterized protein n=3 Tax=Actinomycetes TaxID=1760 RepID=A0ABU2AIL3_9ACTN|nr:hypothetical protein [Glycomyces lechevalierae]MDR7336815.1 hypothetical protein [Glycomyces lechevalierae]
MSKYIIDKPEDYEAKLAAMFATFGIPTDQMHYNPGIESDGERLTFSPVYSWKLRDLTNEQRDAIEAAFNIRLMP